MMSMTLAVTTKPLQILVTHVELNCSYTHAQELCCLRKAGVTSPKSMQHKTSSGFKM
jgi:hypothetical protein